MMQRSATLAATGLALLLAGCGSKAEAPVEQIVVRQPGAPAVAAAAAGDPVAEGKAAFGTCAACHSVAPGGASAAGPNLRGVLGRKAGSLPGFAFSPAMMASRIIWNEKDLAEFLAKPDAKVPGTVMPPVPVGDAQRRAAIVAYLASLKN